MTKTESGDMQVGTRLCREIVSHSFCTLFQIRAVRKDLRIAEGPLRRERELQLQLELKEKKDQEVRSAPIAVPISRHRDTGRQSHRGAETQKCRDIAM